MVNPLGGISQSPQLAKALKVILNKSGLPVGFYKMLFHFITRFWGGVNHPFIGFIASPTCKAYTIAIRLHDYCAIYDPLPRPPVRMPYTIQHWQWQYCVKAKLPGRVNPSPTDYDG